MKIPKNIVIFGFVCWSSAMHNNACNNLKFRYWWHTQRTNDVAIMNWLLDFRCFNLSDFLRFTFQYHQFSIDARLSVWFHKHAAYICFRMISLVIFIDVAQVVYHCCANNFFCVFFGYFCLFFSHTLKFVVEIISNTVYLYTNRKQKKKTKPKQWLSILTLWTQHKWIEINFNGIFIGINQQ